MLKKAYRQELKYIVMSHELLKEDVQSVLSDGGEKMDNERTLNESI